MYSPDFENINEMPKILLVEDETSLVSMLNKGLSEEDFELTVAFDGTTALDMAQQQSFDLIILDILLPDKSGIEICKILREQNILTPIIFLTALGSSDNIALGLNSGGDDYIVKPFKFNELLARIRAQFRRNQIINQVLQKESKNIVIEDLIIDDDAKTVTRSGEKLTLTVTEYRLLMALAKNKGRVVSRPELLEMAWEIDFNLNTNVVDVYINYLRKKVDSKFENKLIQTVVGMGYTIR